MTQKPAKSLIIFLLNLTSKCNAFSQNLLKAIEGAANEELPPKLKITSEKELWKNDEELNSLLRDRSDTIRNGESYKKLSKKIKKRVRQLRNLNMKLKK